MTVKGPDGFEAQGQQRAPLLCKHTEGRRHPGVHSSSLTLFPPDLRRTSPPHLPTPPRTCSLSYRHTGGQRVRLQAQILQLASEGPLAGVPHQPFALSLTPPPHCSPKLTVVLFSEELGEGTRMPGLLPQSVALPLQWKDVPARWQVS